MQQFEKLHLGCGATTPDGWLNVDGSWNVRLSRHHILHALLRSLRIIPKNTRSDYRKDIYWADVSKPLRFADESFSVVYASHLLEHLFLDDARALLRECFRVLKPGGVIRLLVPDLRSIALEYVGSFEFPENDSYGSMTPEVKANRPRADRVNMRLLMHPQAHKRESLPLRIYRAMRDFHTHKWMYDADSLAFYMREAGFVDVEQREYLDSQIEGIDAVEQAVRVLDGSGICVEGVKQSS